MGPRQKTEISSADFAGEDLCFYSMYFIVCIKSGAISGKTDVYKMVRYARNDCAVTAKEVLAQASAKVSSFEISSCNSLIKRQT